MKVRKNKIITMAFQSYLYISTQFFLNDRLSHSSNLRSSSSFEHLEVREWSCVPPSETLDPGKS